MIRPRYWLVVPALLAAAIFSSASAAEIRDKAKLFSPEAVKKAQTELDRLQSEYDVPVTLETIESLEGENITAVTEKHARAVGAQGVYILIPKADHKVHAEASKHYLQYLTTTRMNSVTSAISTEFKAGDFDKGLSQGVAKLGSVFSDAKTDAGGTIRQNSAPNTRRGGAAVPVRKAPAARTSFGGFSLITIILGILAIFFVIRMLGALFGAMRGNQYGGGGGMMGGRGGYPGQGGPGYGGGGYGGAPAGGGGFMSSLFGGIGGAMAGNYLYDKFSGRENNAGYGEQAGYSQGEAPVADNSPDWNGGGATSDWGGDTASTDAPAGGGDWGGGGGGDWGGGGGDTGGGDWGGGGGNDDGGTW